MTRTGFYSDEMTFWHGGVQASILTLPVGGWVQMPNGTIGVDTPDTKRRLLNLINASGLMKTLVRGEPEPVSMDDLRRVHTQDYLDRFKAVSDAGGGELGVAAAFGPGGFEIAQISTGLAVSALDDVITGKVDNAYALCRPCGHHCLPDAPMGSCLFANVAVAIEAAIARHGPLRFAVVDWDVHHGNGTQAIFYNRPDVLTISLHQDRCFPFGYNGLEDRGADEGAGHNINIALPPGSGHDSYLYAFDQIVLPALRDFAPDVLIVASGLDACAVDPLSRMLLHSETYRQMTQAMKDIAAEYCGGKLLIAHEGGYSEAYAPFCGHAIVEALSGQSSPVTDPALEMHSAWQPNDRVLAFHRELIDDMAAFIKSTAPAK